MNPEQKREFKNELAAIRLAERLLRELKRYPSIPKAGEPERQEYAYDVRVVSDYLLIASGHKPVQTIMEQQGYQS